MKCFKSQFTGFIPRQTARISRGASPSLILMGLILPLTVSAQMVPSEQREEDDEPYQLVILEPIGVE